LKHRRSRKQIDQKNDLAKNQISLTIDFTGHNGGTDVSAIFLARMEYRRRAKLRVAERALAPVQS
jgi:hypothetical protein